MADYGETPKPTEQETQKLTSKEEFQKTLFEISKRFTIEEKREFPQIVGREFLDTERLRLADLPDGAVVKVAGGAHLGASYTLEVTTEEKNRMVYVWRSGNCLKGPVDAIVSHEPVAGKILMEKGILQVNKAMHFPYFSEKNGKLEKPKTTWMDTCASLKYTINKVSKL